MLPGGGIKIARIFGIEIDVVAGAVMSGIGLDLAMLGLNDDDLDAVTVERYEGLGCLVVLYWFEAEGHHCSTRQSA